MPNNHRYGFRFVRSLSGASTPQIITLPIATAYQPATIVGAGTNVNLNIGDPVRLVEDGTVQLTQTAQDVSGQDDDSDDFCYGIVCGFPRIIVGGFPRPGSFYTGGTTYTGGIGSDSAPLVSIIPAAGNIFEIDSSAVVGAGTKNAAMALVGGVGTMVYSVLTSGNGQPKANPLLDAASVVKASANQLQLQVVGLGKFGDAMDFAATNLTFQVMWNCLQMSIPTAEMTATAIAGIYGANLE
jgi:hypothetical protein